MMDFPRNHPCIWPTSNSLEINVEYRSSLKLPDIPKIVIGLVIFSDLQPKFRIWNYIHRMVNEEYEEWWGICGKSNPIPRPWLKSIFKVFRDRTRSSSFQDPSSLSFVKIYSVVSPILAWCLQRLPPKRNSPTSPSCPSRDHIRDLIGHDPEVKGKTQNKMKEMRREKSKFRTFQNNTGEYTPRWRKLFLIL